MFLYPVVVASKLENMRREARGDHLCRCAGVGMLQCAGCEHSTQRTQQARRCTERPGRLRRRWV